MKKKELQFSLDILSELSNIGSGNAATALHDLLGKKVNIMVPSAQVVSMEKAKQISTNSESPTNIILFETVGGLEGFLLFLIDEADLKEIYKEVGKGYEIDEDSVVTEVANIICGSYVSSISELMNTKTVLSPPQIAYDMLGSLIDALVATMCQEVDEILQMHTVMQVEGSSINGSFMFLLNKETINTMIGYFNNLYKNK